MKREIEQGSKGGTPPPLLMLLLRLAITPYTIVKAPKALYN
ncbi:hypothetical protein HMPREF1022_02688 [Desulfovibrio sp. 6_1_46AFAA]|nr:hypothetical protein HMPREF1022_02688 [Desulfovibrio sp. 6_1_46AFAA]